MSLVVVVGVFCGKNLTYTSFTSMHIILVKIIIWGFKAQTNTQRIAMFESNKDLCFMSFPFFLFLQIIFLGVLFPSL